MTLFLSFTCRRIMAHLMSRRRTARHEDDADEYAFIAIGEVRSEVDGHIASVTLFELGIANELAYVGSVVNDLRRFFGSWSTGQNLFVRPQDAPRALAAVGPRLEPTQIWTDTSLYLEQCTTGQLIKLLDFEAIWKEPSEKEALRAAERILAGRGITYPPDGTSRRLPAVCLVLAALLGPYVFILRWWMNGKKLTPEGGIRPRYDEKTCQKASRRIKQGLIIWSLLLLLLVVVEKTRSHPPKNGTPSAQQTSRPAS